MHFHFSFYSSILLIFFTQGLVFSFLALQKGISDNDRASNWLSLFIFLCCMYIATWMLGHAGWYSQPGYRDILFYVPFQQLLLIGPVTFFYTQSLLNPAFRLDAKAALHLIPPALYLLYSIIVFVTDQLILHEYYFYANGRDKDLDTWYQQLGWLSMMLYAFLSIRYYFAYKKLIFNLLSYAESVQFDWVRKYLIAFIIMQVCRGVFLFLYPDWGSFPQKWWYYFIFSLLFYYIGFKGYLNTIKTTLSFRLAVVDNTPFYLLQHHDQVTSIAVNEAADDKKNPIAWADWESKILDLIHQQRIYLNPRLTLTDIADLLDTNPTTISRVVNYCFNMNFNDFINHYRVEAMKELLHKGVHQRQTLLGIAYDCGFNSKTTFNRSFKKNTGLSPKDFVAQRLGTDAPEK
jgi:AraC-like DNA-binding protein